MAYVTATLCILKGSEAPATKWPGYWNQPECVIPRLKASIYSATKNEEGQRSQRLHLDSPLSFSHPLYLFILFSAHFLSAATTEIFHHHHCLCHPLGAVMAFGPWSLDGSCVWEFLCVMNMGGCRTLALLPCVGCAGWLGEGQGLTLL